MKALYTFELYKDRQNKWRWRVTARNGRIVADGGEGYTRRADCERVARKLLDTETIPRILLPEIG